MNYKELIKQLIVSFQEALPMEMIDREVELPLYTDKIITVPGVRRCGKSSLMMLAVNRLLADGVDKRRILFLNFDDERLEFTEENLDEIVQAYTELYPEIEMKDVFVFFDEVQMSRGWQPFVRRLYDRYTRRIFLTGSNSRLLSSEIATSLRGRTMEFEEFPLSFREYCRFRQMDTNYYLSANKARLINLFYDYLTFGAFPEIVLGEEEYRDRILQEYYFVMLYKDLVERYDIKNTTSVRYFIKRILANLSKPTSINKIYNEMKSQGITGGKNMLYELAEQTEAIYLLFSLPKYDKSLVKENASDKKYYCIDNGLRNSLVVSKSEDRGALFENLIFLHLRRSCRFNYQLYYYKNKKECDFLLVKRLQIVVLIQVCIDMTSPDTRKRELEGLVAASEETGCSNLLVVTGESEEEVVYRGKKVRIIPAWKWMLEDLPYIGG